MTDNYKQILLKAKDGQDLAVIAGLIQDSILQLSEVKYDEKNKNLVLILNRFCWEVNSENEKPYIRTHSILNFQNVLNISSTNIDMKQDRMYSLLSAIPSNDNDNNVNIFLSFAGGGIIRVKVSKINITVKDVGDYWETNNRPHHENNEVE
ncbi:MAG: DUF2948 family protein [Alphaproteobacteria bacterium]|jgi:hypothetical protein|tara:strand:- start:292 stop:744 length:453 start_codon:yes stop_codon:yes gene_type:complete